MSKITFIYKITNTINQKLYIGKTICKNPVNRWYRHLSIAKNKTTSNHTYQLVHKSINKYGKENFTFEVIEECGSEALGAGREKFWIEFHKTNVWIYGSQFGYNLTAGGDGSSGFKHSEAAKNKMSEDRRGTRLGQENTFFGRHHSKESIKIISEKNKGKKHTQEAKDQISASLKGKKKSKYEMKVPRHGEYSNSAKLTWERVRQIRKIYSQGNITIAQLARENEVSFMAISNILKNKSWKV